LTAAALVAGLAALAAPAAALTLAFEGQGLVQGPAPALPFIEGLRIGPLDALYTLGGEPGWTIDVLFGGVITPTGGWEGQMAGEFRRGADSLQFTGTQAAALLGEPIALSYTVTGGSGAYAGLVGSGISLVQLMGNPLALPAPVPFMEFDGVLNLQPVPEPGTWALWALGLAGVAARCRRAALEGQTGSAGTWAGTPAAAQA
jgi:hypothetical protein